MVGAQRNDQAIMCPFSSLEALLLLFTTCLETLHLLPSEPLELPCVLSKQEGRLDADMAS
jgi:uncharacterized Tic20 family protein